MSSQIDLVIQRDGVEVMNRPKVVDAEKLPQFWRQAWIAVLYGDDLLRHGQHGLCVCGNTDGDLVGSDAASLRHEPCIRVPQWLAARGAAASGRNVSLYETGGPSEMQFCHMGMKMIEVSVKDEPWVCDRSI